MSLRENEEDDRVYILLMNDEGQYSLWPKHKATPAGWNASGFEGGREDCVRQADEIWTDMRPASLRQAMEAAG